TQPGNPRADYAGPGIKRPRIRFEHFERNPRQGPDVFAARAQLHFVTDDRDEGAQQDGADSVVALNISEGHAPVTIDIQIAEGAGRRVWRLQAACDFRNLLRTLQD